MAKIYLVFIFILVVSNCLPAQDFNVKAKGNKKFQFNDPNGRSQATFFSTTPLEDVNGLTTQINGEVSFEIGNLKKSLKGKIIIPVKSLKTGVRKRDEDLQGSGWLDADEFPEISFTIKHVDSVNLLADNKLNAKITGDFMVHGVSKEIKVNVSLVYIEESSKSKEVAPGDLLGVTSIFTITLSDYDIDNIVMGRRVSDKIEIGVNFVGYSR